MAFDITKFDANASGSKGSMALHAYGPTDDTIATIEGASYFNTIGKTIRSGDLIVVAASDGNAWYEATVNATTFAVTIAATLDSGSYSRQLTIDDISITMGAAMRIPFSGTLTTFRSILANIRGSGATGATLQVYYNSTAVATASTLHTSADLAYAISTVSGLTQAVTAGGVLSVVSDGGPTGGLNGGQMPATVEFTIRRT